MTFHMFDISYGLEDGAASWAKITKMKFWAFLALSYAEKITDHECAVETAQELCHIIDDKCGWVKTKAVPAEQTKKLASIQK